MPLMVVAFISVGGFLYWLSVKAVSVEVEVVEGAPIVDENVSTRVAPDVFGSNPMAQADILIEVRGLSVSSLVGSEAFFLAVPNQSGPYLARMLPELAASVEDLVSGTTVTVTGRVYAMSDSVADAWVAGGGIAESDRILAVFAESFLEVERLRVTAQPQPDEN